MNSSDKFDALCREMETFAGKLPPVHSWAPERSGEIDITIKSDGSWYHEGTRIERESLVVLFASILRRDGPHEYVLVTPAERLQISVEDVPFAIADVSLANPGEEEPEWIATTTLGESVRIDATHPIRAGDSEQNERGAAYCVIRPLQQRAAGRLPLEGSLTRAAWYRLAPELQVAGTVASLRSGGVDHELAYL